MSLQNVVERAVNLSLNQSMSMSGSVINPAIRHSAIHRQALTACALERYLLKHHDYPDTLSALVPDFLPKAPIDPLDDAPMRYRKTANGRYQLWSVGPDRIDDGGILTHDPDATAEDLDPLNSPTFKGDWVWSYTPLVQPVAKELE